MGKRGGAAGGGATKAREQELDQLGAQLGDASLVKRLAASDTATADVVEALALLADQGIRMGIDYRKLGSGWHHPSARSIYRSGRHQSITATASRQRAEASRVKLAAAVAGILDGQAEAEPTVVSLFAQEIGLPPGAPAAAAATFPGVLAALRAELLLPLRAQIECPMPSTMCGNPLPEDEMKQAVMAVAQAVLAGIYSEWRYSNPVGREQLRGLTEEQVAVWREPTSMDHARGLRTHEDEPGELGFFWATKIGGPSHGFDYECPCLLPLLSNARHKVVLVSVPQWPHPAGRAHWRFLWAVKGDSGRRSGRGAAEVEPRLWLETVNGDFEAGALMTDAWDAAVILHAVAKADAMRCPLSVETYHVEDLKRAIKSRGGKANIREVQERMVLRPSNGVVEASDYLSSEHDWVQQGEETTHAISRAVYTPEGC